MPSSDTFFYWFTIAACVGILAYCIKKSIIIIEVPPKTPTGEEPKEIVVSAPPSPKTKLNSPLDHFDIDILSDNGVIALQLTSHTLFLLSSIFVLYYVWAFVEFYVVGGLFKMRALLRSMFSFWQEIFKNQLSSLRALRFFPLYFVLFFIIFFFNVLSLSFYNISITGHIMLTLSLSFSFFFFIILLGYLTNRKHLLQLFKPTGVPKSLLYFLIAIEVLSFLIRPFSLAIRLFANMLAGHTLLSIFSSFFSYIVKNFKIFYIIPAILCFLIMTLEFCVSGIQAYVFVVLLIIYLNDVLLIKH